MVSILLLFNLPVAGDDERQRWLADSEMEAALSKFFLPALKGVPGVKQVTVSRCLGGPKGVKRYDRAVKLIFDDQASLKAAVSSPQMMRVVATGMARLRLRDISVTFFDERVLEGQGEQSA